MLPTRPATLADIPAIVTLVTSAYRGESSRAGWTTEADILDGSRIDRELLRADIERPGSVVLLHEDGDGLLACAHVCVADGAGQFGMFAVRPALQGGGVGRAMLAAAERHARDVFGVQAMRMMVIDCRDELIDWYLRRGYRRTGIKKPFPYGDARFGDPRRPDLQFEVLEKRIDG
jgi:GNAT superfamily N-acetyltransferase